ncbi:MAG TPA: hypothetical protein VFN55_07170 [Solirubrobacteraceae bacterium]|nr:hypothetical protein [Solirubrobacteraceae bacterium]
MTLISPASQAGASTNLSLDVAFTASGPSSDSPKDLTVALPPGLLANASINGGACLTATTAVPACQIGSGTVTASPIVLGLPTGLPVRISVGFFLIAPPKAGDLAGVLTVANPGTILASNLGDPADVNVRPSGDPAGVGLTEHFGNLPDTFSGLPISVTDLSTTFTGLRLPATCPSTPASVTVSTDSYADPTVKQTSAPLTVTGCATLPFAPHFSVTATRDTADSGTQVVTDITQAAGEAPSRSTTLVLPPAVLAPNAAAVISNGLLCADPAFTGCKSIGTATTVSPFYPKPLTGQDYLTGTLSSPAITIRFPAPFPLALTGAVTLASGTTAFTNLPDIPLTDLKVTLSGGPAAAFAATCNPAGGTATSTLTTQNGDHTVTASAPFTVSNCPPGSGGGSTGGGTGGGAGGGKGTGSHPHRSKPGRPTVGAGLIQGLGHHRPSLRFTATAGRGAPALASVTVGLPRGLALAVHRRHRRVRISGLSLRGARMAGLSVIRGRLVIRLRHPVRRFSAVLGRGALHESGGLYRAARRHRVHRLIAGVQLRDAARHLSRLRLTVTRIRL